MHLRELARLFSSTVFRQLAEPDGVAIVRQILQAAELPLPGHSVSEAFDRCFEELKKGYRNEYVFKNLITEKIFFGRHSPATSALLTEFSVNDARADIALFNGSSTAYEIKTDLDDLSRLHRQLATYSQFFAKVYAVTSEGLADSVLGSAPDSVGLLVLTARGCLSERRAPKGDLGRLDAEVIFKNLRLADVLNICAWNGREIATGPKLWTRRLCWEAFRGIPIENIHSGMVRAMHSRRLDAARLRLVAESPESLRHFAVAKTLPKRSFPQLITTLGTPI